MTPHSKYIYAKNMRANIVSKDIIYIEFQQTRPPFSDDTPPEVDVVTDLCGVTLSGDAIEFLHDLLSKYINGEIEFSDEEE